MRPLFAAALVVLTATPAAARQSLGMFDGWAAFRDAQPQRCFAISKPDEDSTEDGPYATVSWWPKQGAKGQVHVRLRFQRLPGSDVMLHVGSRRWRLKAGDKDAWGPSPAHDAYIVAKIRESGSMTVKATGPRGGKYAEVYSLKGAASAMDAAALSCARPG